MDTKKEMINVKNILTLFLLSISQVFTVSSLWLVYQPSRYAR
jgi:hypothetical protein